MSASKERIQLYTEDWDNIRKRVYARDGYRCAYCGKKGKLHAHHIIPVRISHDNSMSNLVSLCNKCHKILEMVGFTILERGGGRIEVRKTELTMIMEAKKKRFAEYMLDKEKKIEEARSSAKGTNED